MLLEDFNEKSEEQFGDNSKIFNEGLKKLIEWQDKHILEVEETKRSVHEANKIIQANKQSIESVSSTNKRNSFILSSCRKNF